MEFTCMNLDQILQNVVVLAGYTMSLFIPLCIYPVCYWNWTIFHFSYHLHGVIELKLPVIYPRSVYEWLSDSQSSIKSSNIYEMLKKNLIVLPTIRNTFYIYCQVSDSLSSWSFQHLIANNILIFSWAWHFQTPEYNRS